MIDNAQNWVANWNAAAGNYAPGAPTLTDEENVLLQAAMLREEVSEYVEAFSEDDLVGVADALADLLFVLLGTAHSHGIQLSEVFRAVIKANFSKFDENGESIPHPDIPGKIGKSPNFTPPEEEIAVILESQGAEL